MSASPAKSLGKGTATADSSVARAERARVVFARLGPGFEIVVRRSDKSSDCTAELHFGDGPLSGLKLMGFAVVEKHGKRHVLFPSTRRTFTHTVPTSRKSHALLSPRKGRNDAAHLLAELILEAVERA